MACSPPFRNLGLLDEADRMETDERSHTEPHPAVCHLFDYPVCCDHGSHFGREYPKSPGRRSPAFDLEYHDPGYHGTSGNRHRYRRLSSYIRKGTICLFRNRYRFFQRKTNRNLSPVCIQRISANRTWVRYYGVAVLYLLARIFPLLWDQTQTDWGIRRNSGTRNLRPLFLSAPTPDLLGSALIPDRHMCDQSEA